MQSTEIKQRFLAFFEKRGHSVIPSASLVPENDPSVLFTTAGMQPLVPYLLGQAHPKGKRLVNVQKCVRTGDLEDIGDNRHFSFFQMMGNWSLGDYFKEDAIKWSYEFLTSTEEGLGLDAKRLYVTVFEGNEDAPTDTESIEIWKGLGVANERIYPLGIDDNWWSPGESGPCGPDSEMFYDLTESGLGILSKEAFLEAVRKEELVEIWNNVFMEYEKKDGKVIGKLASKNVDTGAGLERMTAVMQKKKTAYETDLFVPIIEKIKKLSHSQNDKAEKIVADHTRAAVFIIADGVTPSNTDRGYILRRLLRRAVRYSDILGMSARTSLIVLAEVVQSTYKEEYPEVTLDVNGLQIGHIIQLEEEKFRETLMKGLKEFDNKTFATSRKKIGNATTGGLQFFNVTGEVAYNLFTTYGFPIELTEELAKERGTSVDRIDFEKRMLEHKNLSRAGAEQKFNGGLANTSEKTVRLHTAHHLLLSALQKVLGNEVKQRGSNITEERLRMDFSFGRKMTDEEKKEVEIIVNSHIESKKTVVMREMPRVEAETLGAEMEFGAKYPDVVSIYFIEDSEGNVISKEFCGGPHVQNTGELGAFKILKEEAVASGVRRIKAILE